LSCKFLRNRTARHDALVEDVVQWLKRRRVHVKKEVGARGMGGKCDGKERIDIWARCDGVVYWGDVSVVEPAAPSVVVAAAARPGVAVEKAEANKRWKWGSIVPSGVVAQPLALETTGRLGGELEKFLDIVVRATSQGNTKHALLVLMSVTCIKFNVLMVREAGDKAKGLGLA
jgi:hypothetical protein